MASNNDKKNEPDLFDRLADMNGDGKTDLFEELMAYQRISDAFEKTDKDSNDADSKNSSSVRQTAVAKSSVTQKVQPQKTKYENIPVLMAKCFWEAVREMFLPMTIGGIVLTLWLWLMGCFD